MFFIFFFYQIYSNPSDDGTGRQGSRGPSIRASGIQQRGSMFESVDSNGCERHWSDQIKVMNSQIPTQQSKPGPQTLLNPVFLCTKYLQK